MLELIPKATFILTLVIFRIVFMIMSLIDYSKYKVKEANFEFWDELLIKSIKGKWKF